MTRTTAQAAALAFLIPLLAISLPLAIHHLGQQAANTYRRCLAKPQATADACALAVYGR